MSRLLPRRGVVLAIAAACWFSGANGWAALGSALSNLGPPASAMGSSQRSTGLARYTEVTRKLESGTSVHEYVDDSGTVFAVSWSGPFMPDLKEMLGPHFETMAAQVVKRPNAGSAPLIVKQADVVIVSGGHMGAFEGKAWLPPKLPAGFTSDDIQ